MQKEKKKGFTLIELIVVIAILAILAVLAIPAYSGLREETKAATCSANRTSLLHEVLYTAAIAPESDVLAQFDAKRIEESGYRCPADGTIKVEAGRNTGTFSVTCSIHGADAMTVISSTVGIETLMKNALEKYFALAGGASKKELDSTGPNFGQEIKDAVTKALNIQNGSYDFRIYREGSSDQYKIYLFDLTDKQVGDKVQVIGYQYSNGKASEPTAAQEVTVISKTTNDKSDKPVEHLTIKGEDFKW